MLYIYLLLCFEKNLFLFSVRVVDGLSYNRIVEKIVSTNNESENYMLRNFLDSSASQLTTQGIAELLSDLKDGEIAVLFRNNHFQTLAKQKVYDIHMLWNYILIALPHFLFILNFCNRNLMKYPIFRMRSMF